MTKTRVRSGSLSGASTALLLLPLVLGGCFGGVEGNELEPARYALLPSDLGVERVSISSPDPLIGCPRPTAPLSAALWHALDGGGVAETTFGMVDSGQQVQSLVLDLGPYFATGASRSSSQRGDGSAEFVAGEMERVVESMMEELDCELPYPEPSIVGDLDIEIVDHQVVTGVFGYSTLLSGPWRAPGDPGPGLLPSPEDLAFEEGTAPEDQRVSAEGRFTVVDGTVLVGVEMQSTHSDHVDVDELLQVMVDRVEADPLPTRAPDDSLLESLEQ